MRLLSSYRNGISLFIEYDVADVGGRKGTGPFSVEIEKLPTEKFGADLVAFGDSAHGYRRLLISHIRDGSIADRCGVLEVGDLIESINDRRSTDLTLHEAMDLLESTTAKSIKLCVLPSPESAGPSTLPHSVMYGAGLCRTEEVEVILEASQQPIGLDPRRRTGATPTNPFGFSLQPSRPQSRPDEPLTNYPLIKNVIPGGPAYQSGIIQPGDSLLAIQGDSPLGKTIDRLTSQYLCPAELGGPRRLSIVTQYTVAENVIPSCGVFDVRIIKCSASLGINLQASRKSRPGEPLLISKVIPGSVASRCGSISPGDILLAVNGFSLEACSITDAARLLQTSEDIVTLRIKKPHDDLSMPLSDEGLPSCSQSDADVVNDDILSQSADDSGAHPPPRPPRRYRMPKPKKSQHRRLMRMPPATRMQLHQQASEVGSDRKANQSDSLSSDRFSENMCSDTFFEVHKVRLTRAHPSFPWGIVISGTDDVVDAPVFIDSLTPGKPGALSGLLRPGDRILAVNEVNATAPKLAGGSGLTLSSVRARLQQPLEHVTLYIARKTSRSDLLQIPGHGSSDPMIKQYSWGTSSSSATDFNRSLEEDRGKPSPRPPSASAGQLRKQNSASKLTHSRQFPAPLAYNINPCSRDPTNNYFDDYAANFQQTTHRKGQAAGRSTGDLPDVPRQTVDAYLSKDEATPRHHHHHRRHHHRSHQQHSRRRRTGDSWHPQHRRENLEEAEEEEEEFEAEVGNVEVEEDEEEANDNTRLRRTSSTLNLDEIACPGCREAVANEVLNQKRLLMERRAPVRGQVSRRRRNLKLRGRSLEIDNPGDDPVSDTFHRRPHLQASNSYHNLYSRSTVKHSRSDSRLNKDSLEEGGDVNDVVEEEDDDDDEGSAGSSASRSTTPSFSNSSQCTVFSSGEKILTTGVPLESCQLPSSSYRVLTQSLHQRYVVTYSKIDLPVPLNA
uniref:PDZ domain-containing protein n=1 Tax=Mesocestoides corti TaxID=53468 RepID=A0A5K3FNS9_MESCO